MEGGMPLHKRPLPGRLPEGLHPLEAKMVWDFVSECCVEAARDIKSQRLYVVYDGPIPGTSLRASFLSWCQSKTGRQPMECLPPAKSPSARPIMELISLAFGAEPKDIHHKSHGRLHRGFYGWRLRDVDPRIYEESRERT